MICSKKSSKLTGASVVIEKIDIYYPKTRQLPPKNGSYQVVNVFSSKCLHSFLVIVELLSGNCFLYSSKCHVYSYYDRD